VPGGGALRASLDYGSLREPALGMTEAFSRGASWGAFAAHASWALSLRVQVVRFRCACKLGAFAAVQVGRFRCACKLGAFAAVQVGRFRCGAFHRQLGRPWLTYNDLSLTDLAEWAVNNAKSSRACRGTATTRATASSPAIPSAAPQARSRGPAVTVACDGERAGARRLLPTEGAISP
jgi:hypothetical protein